MADSRRAWPNPWRDLRGLPRDMWILFTATLVNRMGTMALPFLVLYLTRSQGYSAERAGSVLAVYGGGALLVTPLAGRLCDRFGPLRVMTASLLLSGMILVAYPLMHGFRAVVAATLAFALTAEPLRPASMTLTSMLAGPGLRKQAFALNRLAINLGMSLGPAAGGFLARVSFPALFAIDGLTSLLAGTVVCWSAFRMGFRAQVPMSGDDAPAGAGPSRNSRSALLDRRFLFFLVALIPSAMVFFQYEAAVPLYLVRDLHLSEAAYGLTLTLNTVMIVLLEVPLNSATAHWSHRRSLALGTFLTAVGFGALGLVRSGGGVALTTVIWTFGEMISAPGLSAYVAEISPAERRGEYMGLYGTAYTVAFILGPWGGTALLSRYGANVLWAAVFCCGLGATLLMLRLRHTSPSG